MATHYEHGPGCTLGARDDQCDECARRYGRNDRGPYLCTCEEWVKSKTCSHVQAALTKVEGPIVGGELYVRAFPGSTLCPVCGCAWNAYDDRCPNPECSAHESTIEDRIEAREQSRG